MSETLTTEQVEEIHDDTLWSVNIQGPDDAFAAKNRAEAIDLATKFNEWLVRTFAAKGLHPYDPTTLWAVPTPWRHDEASHARSLADTEGEYAWLRDPAVSSLATELLALRKRVGELEGALTPSAETKAAYIGEFTIAVERIVNEDDEPVDDGADAPDPYDHIQVPWTTIKQIMAAIRAFALPTPKEPS